MYNTLTLLAIFVFLYSLVAGKLEKSPFSGALIFAGFGLIIGPIGLDIFDWNINSQWLRYAAEITLALVLFTDAANADLKALRSEHQIPQRLLIIGLPLTILLGAGLAWLIFPQLSFIEMAILATILAPTDAALGKAVISNPLVPKNIRESLNVESGLNDGIAVPVLLLFLAMATDASLAGNTIQLSLQYFLEEIGIGLLVGLGLTLVFAHLFHYCALHHWLSKIWLQITVGAMAVSCFAAAQALGGSGFIAAFSGGMLFGGLIKHHKHDLLISTESSGDLMALLTWVAFGSVVVGQTLTELNGFIIIYALLSLTLIRILPVYLSLSGTSLAFRDKLFIGWFGPRGLASIVFLVIVIDEQLPGGELLRNIVSCTIIFSIIAHGSSAEPLAERYAK